MTQGKINIYTCRGCKREIITEDLEEGVTPFQVACKATAGCTGTMLSSFYRVPSDLGPLVKWEWYRPPNDDGLGAWERQHVQNGGLLLRERRAAGC